ncbi:60Kd inner membrane protein-domain-containing protein [Mycena sp. CBHHK59/15]|nr:60Kd inner membrane protein-domain-containing protein [Mycena sp. CBHHK59/15]
MISSSSNLLRFSSLRLTSARSPTLVLPLPSRRLLSTILLNRNQRLQPDVRWRNARWNSTAAAPAAPAASPPPIEIPTEPPTPPDSFVLDSGTITDTIAAIPPLQYGDLMALDLCHWTPAGVVQWSFEVVNVVSGLPWFHTIVAATLLWRAVIFPFAVVGMRNSERAKPIAKQLAATSEEIRAATRRGDTVGAQRAQLAANSLRASAGVSMLGMMAPLIQLPISLGMFFGIKKMCELPVAQLTQSGFALLPDLTMPGPHYVLPLLLAASGNAQLMLGSHDMDTSRPALGHVMNAMRIVSFLVVPWMDRLPSGLLLCLIVTSATAMLQTVAFRVPAIRSALSIPPRLPRKPDDRMPTMRESIRYAWQEYGPGGIKKQRTAAARVQPYVPPAPTARYTAPLPPPAPPRKLEVAAQATSNAPSSLYENPPPRPLPRPKLRRKRAHRKPRTQRSKNQRSSVHRTSLLTC